MLTFPFQKLGSPDSYREKRVRDDGLFLVFGVYRILMNLYRKKRQNFLKSSIL